MEAANNYPETKPSSAGKYMTRASVWRFGKMIAIQNHLREFDGESFSLTYMEDDGQEHHIVTHWWIDT